MFCPACGKSVSDGDAFCPNCGKAIRDGDSTGVSEPMSNVGVTRMIPHAESKVPASNGQRKRPKGEIALPVLTALSLLLLFVGVKMTIRSPQVNMDLDDAPAEDVEAVPQQSWSLPDSDISSVLSNGSTAHFDEYAYYIVENEAGAQAIEGRKTGEQAAQRVYTAPTDEARITNIQAVEGGIYFGLSSESDVSRADCGIYRLGTGATEAERVVEASPNMDGCVAYFFRDGRMYYKRSASIWACDPDGANAEAIYDCQLDHAVWFPSQGTVVEVREDCTGIASGGSADYSSFSAEENWSCFAVSDDYLICAKSLGPNAYSEEVLLVSWYDLAAGAYVRSAKAYDIGLIDIHSSGNDAIVQGATRTGGITFLRLPFSGEIPQTIIQTGASAHGIHVADGTIYYRKDAGGVEEFWSVPVYGGSPENTASPRINISQEAASAYRSLLESESGAIYAFAISDLDADDVPELLTFRMGEGNLLTRPGENNVDIYSFDRGSGEPRYLGGSNQPLRTYQVRTLRVRCPEEQSGRALLYMGMGSDDDSDERLFSEFTSDVRGGTFKPPQNGSVYWAWPIDSIYGTTYSDPGNIGWLDEFGNFSYSLRMGEGGYTSADLEASISGYWYWDTADLWSGFYDIPSEFYRLDEGGLEECFGSAAATSSAGNVAPDSEAVVPESTAKDVYRDYLQGLIDGASQIVGGTPEWHEPDNEGGYWITAHYAFAIGDMDGDGREELLLCTEHTNDWGQTGGCSNVVYRCSDAGELERLNEGTVSERVTGVTFYGSGALELSTQFIGGTFMGCTEELNQVFGIHAPNTLMVGLRQGHYELADLGVFDSQVTMVSYEEGQRLSDRLRAGGELAIELKPLTQENIAAI